MNSECQSIQKLIEAQVDRTPDRVAVDFDGGSLSYGELDRRSNQLAHHLRALGVCPNELVALCVERSLDMMVGLLGILKVGGAYVPLDPAYPIDRLFYMLEDSQAKVLVTEDSLAARLTGGETQVVRLDADWPEISRSASSRLADLVTGADLAYVIYTSGSTGRPKGVEIPHGAVVNLLCSLPEGPALTSKDRLLSVTTPSFDISVLEFFLPLSVGARLFLIDRETALDGFALARRLAETRATVMQATPATWHLLLEAQWPGSPQLRILCGGDTLSPELARGLLKRCGELWNCYGPTEATVYATAQRIQAGQEIVPIGFALANSEIRLLDERGQEATAGAIGEIYIGGAGLARGYLRRPELTAEKFVPHPFDSRPGARLYRTGDLGRFRDDGSLEHLGRIDHQVKVRGFRIELGEIEAALEREASVQQAVVTACEEEPGDKRLIAYVTAPTGKTPKGEKLREKLREALPDYMLPAAFVVLDRFPLTANGKVDRNALPAPGSQRPALSNEFIAPRTPTEARLAEMYDEVLRVDRVGAGDDFFDLGGDSLRAAQVVARVRDAFDVELSLFSLFEHPRIADLARIIEVEAGEGRRARQAPIGAAPRTGQLPLSFAQQRIWLLYQLYPDNLAYNFQSNIRFEGPLDVRALERTLVEIVRRHEIFRTTFPIVDDEPSQLIHAAGIADLPLVDLSELAEGERAVKAQQWCESEFQKTFDITRLPLVRWALLKHREDVHVLVHQEHHLVHDGWSFNVFLAEFVEIYSAFAAGRPSPLPELPIQFADFAVWQRREMQGEVAASQIAYWKRKLAEMPPLLELPTARPRPKTQTFAGAAPRPELPLELCGSLRVLSRSLGSTMFMTTLAGFAALLHRYTGRSDVPVGTFFANRRRRESEGLIGMVLNNAVIRASLAGDPTLAELVGQVRNLVLEGANHQDVPFDRVVAALRPRRDPSFNPLFQVMFSFHEEPMPEQGPPGLDVEITPVISNGSAKFDLGVILIPHSAQHLGLSPGSETDGLTMIWEYNTDLFDADTIQHMTESYVRVLETMVIDPHRRVSELVSGDLPDGLQIRAASDVAASAPGVGASCSEVYVEPASDLERQIAEIWQEVLRIAQVGRNDNFFDLGGHSLLATRILNRLRAALGIEVPMRMLFDAMTVADLAANILDHRIGELDFEELERHISDLDQLPDESDVSR